MSSGWPPGAGRSTFLRSPSVPEADRSPPRPLSQVVKGEVATAQLDGVGHYAALEAPEALADAVLRFLASIDR
jgi:pimeloyl-ACP methyl ester carboxylesterase